MNAKKRFNRPLRNLPGALLPLLALLFACCDGEDQYVVEQNGLHLSSDSYTFDASGQTAFRVEVTSGSDWDHSVSDDWILISDRDETSLTLAVKPYQGNAPRRGEVIFSTAEQTELFVVEQLASAYDGIFRILSDIGGNVTISKNGKLIAGLAPNDDATEWLPVVIETFTGERTVLAPVEGISRINAVSDDGKTMVIECGSGNARILKDGVVLEVEVNGYTNLRIEDVSADGTVWVGYGIDSETKKNRGIAWRNGVPEPLETTQVNGIGKQTSQGVVVRGCSADGSVIYGSMMDAYELVYWKDGVFNFAGLDVVNLHEEEVFGGAYLLYDRPTSTRQNYRMSPNGRYLAADFVAESYVPGERRPTSATYPCVIDLEKGESRVMYNYSDHGAMTVQDDGTVFCAAPATGVETGSVLEEGSEELVPLSDWLSRKHGLQMLANRCVAQTGDNGNVLFGMEKTASGGYRYWYAVISRTGQN